MRRAIIFYKLSYHYFKMILQTAIQLYSNVKDNTGTSSTVAAAIQKICSNDLQKNILKLRDLQSELAQKKEVGAAPAILKKQDELISKCKGSLPAVTWSGTFNKRSAKELQQHSGLICLDIDKLLKDELAFLLLKIKKDPHTFICFISPSGNGLKVIIKIDATAENHIDFFKSLEAYYLKTFKIEIDKSGKDVSRLCFLTYDTNIFVNENSLPYELPGTAQPETHNPKPLTPLNKAQQTDLQNTGEDLYSVIYFTEKISSYIEGNHNNFIHLFACNANRKGFLLNDVLSFAVAHFSNKPQREIEQTVKSAYAQNTNEHGKFIKGNNVKSQNFSSKNKPGNTNKPRASGTPQSNENKNEGANNRTGGETEKNADVKPFWYVHKFTKGKGPDAYQVERLTLSRVDFSDFLFSQGFHLLKTGKAGYQVCHSSNGIIKPVEPQQIKQFVLNWCRAQGLREVEEMLRTGQTKYFSLNELDSLPYKEIDFKKDTKDESFFYFKNCWVKVSATAITTHQYKDLKQYIWEGNKIDADFTLQPSIFDDAEGNISTKAMQCEFARFLALFSYNPNSLDEKDFSQDIINERFWSIANSYGFMLDGYKHPAVRKGIFAVDHKIGDKGEQHGRTGKSIIPKAASYLKVVSTINGKSFNPQYQFKYEPITMDSQIVNFNDMPRNFDVETIFEVIADDYSITRRNNGYINFLYTDSPKPYISTNFTPKGEGASYTGRMHIIEACDYFSDTHSPYDEFGHALFTDWSPEQWNTFYNTSFQCVQGFKTLGLLPYPKGNFEIRKLVNDVVPEFIDFMDNKEDVPRNERLGKISLFDKFNKEVYNSLYGQNLKPHTFHKWVKQYCKNRGLQFNPHKNGNHDKSNGKEYYLLADSAWKEDQIKLL